VEQGVAYAEDVAMSTADNRIALHGGLDFAEQEFRDVTVAVVDPRGCPLVRPRILGPFDEPTVENPSFFRTVAGPLIQLLRPLKKECEPFYTGSLAAPEPKKEEEKKKKTKKTKEK
jgi:AsmA protein